jgi:hypothetical protein
MRDITDTDAVRPVIPVYHQAGGLRFVTGTSYIRH